MRTTTRIVISGALLTAVILAGGCYEKVVAAHGPGADSMVVEKGNLPAEKGNRTLGYPKSDFKKLPGG